MVKKTTERIELLRARHAIDTDGIPTPDGFIRWNWVDSFPNPERTSRVIYFSKSNLRRSSNIRFRDAKGDNTLPNLVSQQTSEGVLC